MKIFTTSALLGALAVAALASTTPVSAMPASALAPIVAADAASGTTALEHVRLRRHDARRYYGHPGWRRGYHRGWRGYGYRRPGPIRRILRAL